MKYVKDFAACLGICWLAISAIHVFMWVGMYIIKKFDFSWELQFIFMWISIPAATFLTIVINKEGR